MIEVVGPQATAIDSRGLGLGSGVRNPLKTWKIVDSIVWNSQKLTKTDQKLIKNDEKISCGILAKEALIKKIGNKIPKCINGGKDFYKRTLAECFVDGESLSKFLVRNGYAFAYRKYSKKFIEDERFAKENKLGLWSMKFKYPWEFRKL